MQMEDEAQVQIARLLLTKGMLDIEARNGPCKTGFTALHFASSSRKPGLVKYLVEEAGADVNAIVLGGINDGMTSLGLAEFGAHAMGPIQLARKSAVVGFLRSVGATGGIESSVTYTHEGDEPEATLQVIDIDVLIGMGFDRTAISDAMDACEGDPEEAMNRLLGET